MSEIDKYPEKENHDENENVEKEEKEEEKEELGKEDSCFTPIYKKEQIKRDKASNSVEVVDLVRSPKKRKLDIGLTPYSRNCIYIWINS